MDQLATQPLITNPVYIFFVVLSIILLAPLCLNRLKIPHIIGLIVAGVVVGPYGFQILDRDSSFEIFGQVGILYLMFLAGIEIDMYHLKKNLGRGLAFGLYTFFIPMIVGTFASIYLLKMDVLSSVLLASMYASHTLIAYPIVARFGITKNKTILITITGTIITVLGALIVLAVVIGIHTDGEFKSYTLFKLLGGLALYLLAIVYAYPRITTWFFKKYNDNVMQFVFIIALVFLASTVSQIVGIEPVLGAFFAGLVLNRYIPNASPLMNRIEFVGNAIFIPYFLIGVGMLINMRVVISSWDTIYVAINMSVVATLCKWIAAWITQKTYKLTSLDRNMMFGLSNAQAAATLAAVMIGYKVGIFDEAILNGTILMILVTCAISSIVTENAAAKMKLEMINDKEESEKAKSGMRKRARILITVSNPLTISGLVNIAILARSEGNKNPLFGLHVRNDNTEASLARARNALNIAESTAASADVKFESIDRFDINTTTGIVNTTLERNITDVIIGLHQKSMIVDSFLGSKIEQLLSQMNRMVIISRCFIPLNTITRIVVIVPEKAEFETGFRDWVARLGNITRQVGCRIIFCAHRNTTPFIRGVIHEERIEIRNEYREFDDWNDFVLLANKVLDDDLLVVISARRTSISFQSEMDNMPGFLSRYFAHNNLMIIYPEQFGESPQLMSFSDPMISDLNIAPSNMWLKVRAWYKWLIIQKKKITHRNRNQKHKLDL
ncbi:MAG: cation:proton antiporter [Muribaculaceae bacterium]|nr:cation:proton antiporter [Muribaculaceae bacterium]